MNQANEVQDTAFAILHQMWQVPSRRAATALVLSWAVILLWLDVGSADFFRQHFASVESDGHSVDAMASFYETGMAFLLLLCLPFACAKFAWGATATDCGLGIGDRRRWLPILLASLPLFVVVASFGAASEELREVYPRDRSAGHSVARFALYSAGRFFFYLAFEFHFRGFLQFALSPALGKPSSCVVQAVMGSLEHLRGPTSETVGALVGGLWWGAHAMGSKTVWGTTLQHWFLGLTVDALICFA